MYAAEFARIRFIVAEFCVGYDCCYAAAARHSGYERFQVLAADRVLQLGDRFGFDLPDAFAGDLEDAADFFERVGVAVGQAVSQADDFPLAERQRLEQLFDSLAQQAVVGQLVRGFGARVLRRTRRSSRRRLRRSGGRG